MYNQINKIFGLLAFVLPFILYFLTKLCLTLRPIQTGSEGQPDSNGPSFSSIPLTTDRFITILMFWNDLNKIFHESLQNVPRSLQNVNRSPECFQESPSQQPAARGAGGMGKAIRYISERERERYQYSWISGGAHLHNRQCRGIRSSDVDHDALERCHLA